MAPKHASRRTFVKTMAAGAAAFALPARSYARILGANDRVSLGMIGVGRQMRGHIRRFAGEPDVTIVALADVYERNLQHGKTLAADAEAYADFRRIIDRKDVDAVVIATPDHWHALPTIMAAESGKDVYVEKPTATSIAESRAMVDAARKHSRMVQVGTQQRSGDHFKQAVDLVRSGALGPISFVRTWNYSNDYPDGFGNPPDEAPPPGLDWEMWLGPAPRRPFNINRFGVVLDANGDFQRWASWRYFWDYGGGMMTDWGVHLLDIVQWALGEDYPMSVSAAGGKFYIQDNRDTPDTLQATYRYPKTLVVYENRLLNGHGVEEQGYGIMFHGTEGTMYLSRSGFKVMPQEGKSLEAMEVQETGESYSHRRAWLDAIKSRNPPNNDIEIGHRSSSTAMLGNIAYRTGRTITWDGRREQILHDPEASALLATAYHGPWKLEG